MKQKQPRSEFELESPVLFPKMIIVSLRAFTGGSRFFFRSSCIFSVVLLRCWGQFVEQKSLWKILCLPSSTQLNKTILVTGGPGSCSLRKARQHGGFVNSYFCIFLHIPFVYDVYLSGCVCLCLQDEIETP